MAASCGDGDPVPVAFVQPRPGLVLDEAALRACCLQQLASFKVPERIVVVDQFPIVESPNGPKVRGCVCARWPRRCCANNKMVK